MQCKHIIDSIYCRSNEIPALHIYTADFNREILKPPPITASILYSTQKEEVDISTIPVSTERNDLATALLYSWHLVQAV